MDWQLQIHKKNVVVLIRVPKKAKPAVETGFMVLIVGPTGLEPVAS